MCAQWTHFMKCACACVFAGLCAGVQVSQVNQANAYLIFIRSSIGRQLLNSHSMHTECPNDYKVNNNCYAIYTNVWNSCINSWSQSRGCVSVCVCMAGGANAQSIVGNKVEGCERKREGDKVGTLWKLIKFPKLFLKFCQHRNVDNKLIGVCCSQISTHMSRQLRMLGMLC